MNGGNLSITVTDVPALLPAQVLVTGPNGFHQAVSITGGQTQTLTGLVPGRYTVTAATAAEHPASPPTQVVTIEAGQTTTASVSYGGKPGG